VADMQRYFTHLNSNAFVPSSNTIIPNILLLINSFKELGLPVIISQHFNEPGDGMMGQWWNKLIEREDEDFRLCEELKGIQSSFHFEKREYDAFRGTNLEEFLTSNKIKSLIITGVMANLCVETTARSAFTRGFQPLIPVDATATYNRQMHTATFVNLSFGFMPLAKSNDIIQNLKPGHE
jgi:nicotinamidase-related amidase